LARRRRYTRTRTVYRKARRGYRSRKGLLSGNIGNIFWGAAAGAASGFIPQVVGKWTNPAAFIAGGYLLKKPALMSVGGYELGKMLISGNGVMKAGNNGFWEG